MNNFKNYLLTIILVPSLLTGCPDSGSSAKTGQSQTLSENQITVGKIKQDLKETFQPLQALISAESAWQDIDTFAKHVDAFTPEDGTKIDTLIESLPALGTALTKLHTQTAQFNETDKQTSQALLDTAQKSVRQLHDKTKAQRDAFVTKTLQKNQQLLIDLNQATGQKIELTSTTELSLDDKKTLLTALEVLGKDKTHSHYNSVKECIEQFAQNTEILANWLPSLKQERLEEQVKRIEFLRALPAEFQKAFATPATTPQEKINVAKSQLQQFQTAFNNNAIVQLCISEEQRKMPATQWSDTSVEQAVATLQKAFISDHKKTQDQGWLPLKQQLNTLKESLKAIQQSTDLDPSLSEQYAKLQKDAAIYHKLVQKLDTVLKQSPSYLSQLQCDQYLLDTQKAGQEYIQILSTFRDKYSLDYTYFNSDENKNAREEFKNNAQNTIDTLRNKSLSVQNELQALLNQVSPKTLIHAVLIDVLNYHVLELMRQLDTIKALHDEFTAQDDSNKDEYKKQQRNVLTKLDASITKANTTFVQCEKALINYYQHLQKQKLIPMLERLNSDVNTENMAGVHDAAKALKESLKDCGAADAEKWTAKMAAWDKTQKHTSAEQATIYQTHKATLKTQVEACFGHYLVAQAIGKSFEKLTDKTGDKDFNGFNDNSVNHLNQYFTEEEINKIPHKPNTKLSKAAVAKAVDLLKKGGSVFTLTANDLKISTDKQRLPDRFVRRAKDAKDGFIKQTKAFLEHAIEQHLETQQDLNDFLNTLCDAHNLDAHKRSKVDIITNIKSTPEHLKLARKELIDFADVKTLAEQVRFIALQNDAIKKTFMRNWHEPTNKQWYQHKYWKGKAVDRIYDTQRLEKLCGDKTGFNSPIPTFRDGDAKPMDYQHLLDRLNTVLNTCNKSTATSHVLDDHREQLKILNEIETYIQQLNV